jgi:hypothetical protein
MYFDKPSIARDILYNYHQSWWLWIFLLILGILFIKYNEKLGTSRRHKNRLLESGAGLIALSLLVHVAVIWALLHR